ncbi:MAG: hypothetical protein CME62_05630 [Halobacteriovoraceae bacterium]|nr:hypothetical protein [Halobacteriovoraceae bacterium]
MSTPKILILTLILTLSAYADYQVKQIHAPGELSQDSYSVFLDNGEIIEVEESNLELIDTLTDAMNSQSKVSITKISNNTQAPDLIADAIITERARPQIKQMYSPEGFEGQKFRTLDPLENANISMLPSYDAAQKVMNGMKGGTHDDSQCYNRAHMWTYEALAYNRVNLGKLWIYFSRKYIREFRYKWWFHVAPYTHVNDANKRYVLDRGFTKIPYNVENWKNIFIQNKAQCREVKSYTMYERENGSGREYCYFMFSSQYYWQPYQLENLAEDRQQTWGYRENQMKIAYKDALRRRWDRVVPVLPATPVRGDDGRVISPVEPPREVRSYRGFREGTKVLYANRWRGEIEEVYSDGMVRVDLEGADDVMARVEDLGREVEYFQGWEEDDDVYDSRGRKGDIEHLFDNGWAIVDIDNYRPDVAMPLSSLRKR